jgi:hypothetical protein
MYVWVITIVSSGFSNKLIQANKQGTKKKAKVNAGGDAAI